MSIKSLCIDKEEELIFVKLKKFCEKKGLIIKYVVL